MDEWEREQIRSANARLRSELDAIQADFDREMGQVGEVQRKLAAMRVHATSPNDLARVTVDSSGAVTEITIADDAFRRSTPRGLTEDINAAIRGGAEAAARARAQVLAPLTAIVETMPDLGEIIPGATNLRDLRAQLSEQPGEPPQRSH
ncbi:YbaB/EbfC family nucleoid-associated protein [Nocardia terpenica]|uniref:YbaB/EbfC family nucleoid-associated protein n=1 Tax=Nocardia terpenica TaxID=455432 RepID=UPI002FE06A9A